MTFPIDPNIPAANNDPADDQPLMQQNFSNINQYLQVDHTNPSGTGAGRHARVTFNANNVPGGFPVTPPVLFTNNQDGFGNNLPGLINQLFYYSGSSAQSNSQYLVGTLVGSSGSTCLFGGLILKWGPCDLNNPANNVTFASPFPNQCFSVYLQPNDAAYTGTGVPVSITRASFSARRQAGSGATGAYYLAIGN